MTDGKEMQLYELQMGSIYTDSKESGHCEKQNHNEKYQGFHLHFHVRI